MVFNSWCSAATVVLLVTGLWVSASGFHDGIHPRSLLLSRGPSLVGASKDSKTMKDGIAKLKQEIEEHERNVHRAQRP